MAVTPRNGPADPGKTQEKYDLNADGKIDQNEYDQMTDAEKDQFEKGDDGFYKKKGEKKE